LFVHKYKKVCEIGKIVCESYPKVNWQVLKSNLSWCHWWLSYL